MFASPIKGPPVSRRPSGFGSSTPRPSNKHPKVGGSTGTPITRSSSQNCSASQQLSNSCKSGTSRGRSSSVGMRDRALRGSIAQDRQQSIGQKLFSVATNSTLPKQGSQSTKGVPARVSQQTVAKVPDPTSASPLQGLAGLCQALRSDASEILQESLRNLDHEMALARHLLTLRKESDLRLDAEDLLQLVHSLATRLRDDRPAASEAVSPGSTHASKESNLESSSPLTEDASIASFEEMANVGKEKTVLKAREQLRKKDHEALVVRAAQCEWDKFEMQEEIQRLQVEVEQCVSRMEMLWKENLELRTGRIDSIDNIEDSTDNQTPVKAKKRSASRSPQRNSRSLSPSPVSHQRPLVWKMRLAVQDLRGANDDEGAE